MGLSSLCLTFLIQNTTTERIDLPSCIRSKPLLISSSLRTCVIIGSISILPFMYQSTSFGTSVRPRAPPNAVPFQTRPGTSWNGRVDEMGHAKAAAPFLLAVVEVDPDDLVGAHHPRALNDVEPDPAKPEHHHVGARRDLGGVDHSTDARRHAAADVAALVERRVLADLGDGDFRQHGKVRESRAAHVVEDQLAPVAKARGAVRHQPLALGGADRGAEIGFLAQAAFALAAFRRVKRDHMIARLHRNHTCSDLANNAGALMAEDRRKDSFAVEAVKGVGVGVADAGRLDFNQDFAGLWPIEIKLDDFKRLLCFECDSGACLHPKLHFRFSRYRKNILSPAFRPSSAHSE